MIATGRSERVNGASALAALRTQLRAATLRAEAAALLLAVSRGRTCSLRRGARRPLSSRRAARVSRAPSIAPAKLTPCAAVGCIGRGGALTPPAVGNGRIVALTTGDYRFRFSVSIRTSSETVIVFEFAW